MIRKKEKQRILRLQQQQQQQQQPASSYHQHHKSSIMDYFVSFYNYYFVETTSSSSESSSSTAAASVNIKKSIKISPTTTSEEEEADNGHHDHDHGQGQGQPIHIIGAGLPRTGTESLQEALNILGYKTYHCKEMIKSKKGHLKMWTSLLENITSTDDDDDDGRVLYRWKNSSYMDDNDDVDVEKVFHTLSRDGYNATLDFPTLDYLDKQLQMYPNAKVLLTIRDDATTWAKSYTNLVKLITITGSPFQLWPYYYPNPLGLLDATKDMNKIRCAYGTGGGRGTGEEGPSSSLSLELEPCKLINFNEGSFYDDDAQNQQRQAWLENLYHKHYDKVVSNIPKDKLLIYNVKDGWKPLCTFLGVPIPTTRRTDGFDSDFATNDAMMMPFPHLNESVVMEHFGYIYLLIVYLWIPISVMITLMVAKRCCRRCFSTTKNEKQET